MALRYRENSKYEIWHNHRGYTITIAPLDTRSGKIPKTGTIFESPSTRKYNTRLITNIINHVATFKNESELHRGSYYHACIDPKTDTTTVEPTINHIHYDTTGYFEGYIYLLNMDELVQNEPGRMSQEWKTHTLTDTK